MVTFVYNKSAHERMWQQQFSGKDTRKRFAVRRAREREDRCCAPLPPLLEQIYNYELFSGNSIFMKLSEGRNSPVKTYHHLHFKFFCLKDKLLFSKFVISIIQKVKNKIEEIFNKKIAM
jgi:hypothetical protein